MSMLQPGISDPAHQQTWVDLARAFSERVGHACVPENVRGAGCGDVVVAVFDLGNWRGFLPQAAALLDPAEAARVGRQRSPEQRALRTVAYALHRLLLAAMTGEQPDQVEISRDANGCPRLPRDVRHTSLCHAGTRIACAVSAVGPVGVDMEPVSRLLEMEEIAGYVAHPDELRALAGMDAVARGMALLELWVRKEALLKAAGIGLALEMERFVAPMNVTLALPGGTEAGREMRLVMPDIGGDWRMAVAMAPGARLEVFDR